MAEHPNKLAIEILRSRVEANNDRLQSARGDIENLEKRINQITAHIKNLTRTNEELEKSAIILSSNP